MTLKGIRLGNFKAFGPTQRVPLRPITLLFGANSAGKSSVLHALGLAHHATETGELDVQRTRIGGDSIDLGGFRQFVHGRQRGQVKLAFELDAERMSGPGSAVPSNAKCILVELTLRLQNTGSSRPGVSDVGSVHGGEVVLGRFGLEVDGQSLLTMSARHGGALSLDLLNHEHPVFRSPLHEILSRMATDREVRDASADLAGVVNELVRGIVGRRQGLLPRIEEAAGIAQEAAETGLLTASRVSGRRQRADAARSLLTRTLRNLLGGVTAAIEAELRSLLYLGPMRSIPPRNLAFSEEGRDSNWHAGGGWAWDTVREREDLRLRVNQWLGNREWLKTPYRLEEREFLSTQALFLELPTRLEDALSEFATDLLREMHAGVPSEVLSSAMDAVGKTLEHPRDVSAEQEAHDQVARVIESFVDADREVSDWLDCPVQPNELLDDLVLVDRRSGTAVSHRDVGVGVSQVLPVLVSAYASERKLLAIEQPEIHLHPALQAELGDVFIESALGGAENRFLIETHSEHLILRILRRIRETSDGELPEGATPVRPDQVAVLYVQPGQKGAEIVDLPITPDGDFERPWPDGFFAERAEELF